MTSSQDLIEKTLAQYDGKFADQQLQEAIGARNASVVQARAKQLLAETPAPSRSRLLLDASGGQPLTAEELEGSRLHRLVDSLEMVVNFTSTIDGALREVRTSTQRP